MAYILKNEARPDGSEVRNIKVGDSEIKYIITGEGSLFYDIQHYIEYDIPELTFLYPDVIIPAEGGKLKPSVLEFKQKWRRVGYSGNKYELEIITEGAEILYHVLSGEDITVDEFGEIEWKSRGINFDENERIAVILMTVIINGLENYINATVKLAKNIIERVNYGEPSGLVLTTLDIPASGGVITEGYIDGIIVQNKIDVYSSKEPDIYEIYPYIINDYYSEPIEAGNLETTIKERSIVGELVYYYNCNGVIGSCFSDVYQLANEADAYYDYPIISEYSYVIFPAEGDTKLPSVSYYLYSYYTSGSPCNIYTSGGILRFRMPEADGFVLNSKDTGEIIALANDTINTRYSYPQVSVLINDLASDFVSTECILEGLAEFYIINDIYLNFSAKEETKSFIVTYDYYIGEEYIYSAELSDYTITEIFNSGRAFSSDGSTITAEANESLSSRSTAYLISADGYDDGYIYCYLDGDTVDYITIYLSSGFNEDNPCPAKGGSCTVIAEVTKYWVSGDITYDTPTLISNNPALTITNVDSSTYKATWSANTETGERSATITASYSELSDDITLYLIGIVKEWLTISSFTYGKIPPDGGSVTPTIGTITYHVNYSNGSNDSLIISKDECVFTYSLDNTTNFTIDTTGKVSSKSVNNSGDDRIANVTCYISYDNASTTISALTTLLSNYYYLTLVNPYNKDILAIICYGHIPATPLPHGEITEETILVPAGESIEINVTKGILVNVGPNGSVTTKTSDCLLTIYSWDGENMINSGNIDFIMYYKNGLSHGL